MEETTASASEVLGPYTGLTVIELSNHPGGEQLGRLLVEHGATVTKVEPPDGAPSRAVGPWAGGVISPDTSLSFWFYNAGKNTIVLDLRGDGHRQLGQLLATADVFITTLRSSELGELGISLDDLLAMHTSLVIVSVTGFGLTGPWANRRSSDLIGLAGGGPLSCCGYDDHTIPPIRPGGNQAYHSAASHAHMGLLLALLERQSSRRGQLVDVSMHEAMAVGGELANPYYFYGGVNLQRQTCRHAQPEPTQPALFECADGKWVFFAFILSDPKTWGALVGWLAEFGIAADLEDPAYEELSHRQSRFSHIQGLVESLFLLQSSEDAYEQGQRRGLAVGPLRAPEEVVDDDHLRAREFFAKVDVNGTTVPYPRSPIRMSPFQHRIPVPPPSFPGHAGRATTA